MELKPVSFPYSHIHHPQHLPECRSENSFAEAEQFGYCSEQPQLHPCMTLSLFPQRHNLQCLIHMRLMHMKSHADISLLYLDHQDISYIASEHQLSCHSKACYHQAIFAHQLSFPDNQQLISVNQKCSELTLSPQYYTGHSALQFYDCNHHRRTQLQQHQPQHSRPLYSLPLKTLHPSDLILSETSLIFDISRL